MNGGLNKQQEEAVKIRGTDVFLNAGPGSGKTRTIIERIKSLTTDDEVEGKKILAITFTNKAADVMKQRLQSLSVDSVRVSTFHKLAVFLLRKSGRKFTIYDESDVDIVLKKILRAYKNANLDDVKKYIEERKDNLIYPHEDSGDYKHVYEEYQRVLIRNRAMDFSDLIMLAVECMENSQFRESVSSRWEHILVDEMQDTSHSQFKLLELLRNGRACTFIVGDVDQAIYEWRNARPQNILDFIHSFHPKVINMGTNYRSPSAILVPAQRLIRMNKSRVHKKLVSAVDELGNTPVVHRHYDSVDEAYEIVKLCKEADKYSDVAIVYRSNWMSGQLEMALNKEKVPYKTLDSVGFFERMEVKDVVSYCRVAYNGSDNVALVRSLSTPKRGFGKKTFQRISSLDDLTKATKLTSKQSDERRRYKSCIGSIQDGSTSDRLESILRTTFIEELNYLGYTEEHRQANISQLCTMAKGKTLEDFVTETSLVKGDKYNNKEAVSLMTMHSAKGTEFPIVVMIGCEECITPHIHSENLEEERRLFYVSMTRAKEELHINWCKRRGMFGKYTDAFPSRFIGEAGLCTSS